MPPISRPKRNRSRRRAADRDPGTLAQRAPRPIAAAAQHGADTTSTVIPVRPALLALGCMALSQVLAFTGPADGTLRRFFKQHPQLGRRDRGFIAETVFAVLRRLSHFTQVCGVNDTRALFIAAAHTVELPERRDLAAAISAEESHWIARLSEREPARLTAAMRAELPDWIVTRLARSATPEYIRALGIAMQAPAPLDLRVNTLLIGREEAIDALRASGYTVTPTPHSPIGLRVQGKPALERHPLFLSGKLEVQDEGSQLLCLLVAAQRREMVADFCAGAGGKTLALGQLMRSQGRIYAFDISAERILRLRKRVARAGLSNVHPEVIAHENDARLKRLAQKFDRVLVDAPCTGTGTLRRNPDLKWRLREENLTALCSQQAAILAAAARLTRPGGRLVYATCSVLPEENDVIVSEFLQQHPDFAELDCQALLSEQGIAIKCGPRLRLLPHIHGTDGFFAAALVRGRVP